MGIIIIRVPNAPCGVESRMEPPSMYSRTSFLMHRVELKGHRGRVAGRERAAKVPNAPCGVESRKSLSCYKTPLPFLMHRVELKEDRYCCVVSLLLSS